MNFVLKFLSFFASEQFLEKGAQTRMELPLEEVSRSRWRA
jgi:hypothetical protein